MGRVIVLFCVILITYHYAVSGGEDKLGTPYFLTNMKVESYILPFLNYSSMMLIPYIDQDTIEAHYHGHHEAYRKKTNALLKKWRAEEPESELAKESILYILRNLGQVPEQYRDDVRNQGGGFVNHCFYWGSMSPNLEEQSREPTGPIAEEIQKEFDSFDNFKKIFTEQGVKLFGSGYVWLIRTKENTLDIVTTQNQDSPLSYGDFPILVLDVWEHAYYLKHKFKRANHIEDWWYVVDWNNVNRLDSWWKEINPTLQPKDEL